jgi:hypothetical protein
LYQQQKPQPHYLHKQQCWLLGQEQREQQQEQGEQQQQQQLPQKGCHCCHYLLLLLAGSWLTDSLHVKQQQQ